MAEKKITLTEIDPAEIYGKGDKIINHLCSYFPELKVVTNDSTIKLKGSYKDIDSFENALSSLKEKKMHKRHLNTDDVDSIFAPKSTTIEASEIAKGSRVEPPMKPDTETKAIVIGNGGKIITAKTSHQKELVARYALHDLMFAIGPAGTGKTYTAIALAVRALQNKEVHKLILTRPAVEAGEKLGFLPGDLKEKLDPYLQPLYDALQDMIPARALKELIDTGVIQIAPLAYMRGRTLEGAFVILDEAQNTSLGQLKMFLTRMGHGSKFIVTGDLTQIDLPNKNDSGLARCVSLLSAIPEIAFIEFDTSDIVRHPLVSKIVKIFT